MRPASTPSQAIALAEGGRLFNAGRFFDAHEAWEAAWRVETGAARRVLQGLIQVAAGFHKGLVQGRPSGMVRLLGAGLSKIAEADGLGLSELHRFRTEVAAWLEAARHWSDGGARPMLPLPMV